MFTAIYEAEHRLVKIYVKRFIECQNAAITGKLT